MSGDVDQRVLIDTRADVDGFKARAMQHRHELVAVPLAHRQSVLLSPAIKSLCADRHVDAAVVLVDCIDPDGQRDLTLGGIAPISYAPAKWLFLVVEDKRSPRQESLVQLSQRVNVLFTGAAETEDPAADDRGVVPRRVELVQWRYP
jgi:hypothetical protein